MIDAEQGYRRRGTVSKQGYIRGSSTAYSVYNVRSVDNDGYRYVEHKVLYVQNHTRDTKMSIITRGGIVLSCIYR